MSDAQPSSQDPEGLEAELERKLADDAAEFSGQMEPIEAAVDAPTVTPLKPPSAQPLSNGDADVPAVVLEDEASRAPGDIDGSSERSYRRLIAELKAIEQEIRELLESKDAKRKRRFSGTRRWLDLEEDILEWRFSGRFEDPTLLRVQQLIARRHYLFRRLRFLAGTRPTWNT
jgi:hypothetical protein